MASLELTGTRVDAEAFAGITAALADAADPLVALSLAMCKVGVEGAARLAASLERTAGASALRDLDLSWNELGSDGTAKLAAALHGNSSALRRIVLANNRIGADGAARLSYVLATNRTLRCVDLSGNELGGEGAAALVADGFGVAERVDLQVNGVDDSGAEAIAKALRGGNAAVQLSELVLSYNSVGNRGAAALAKALARSDASLVELHLWANAVGNEGACALAEMLETNASLTCVDLSDNKFGGADVAERFAVALAKNTSLLRLETKGAAGFEGPALARIEAALARNRASLNALFAACAEGRVEAVRSALAASPARTLRVTNSANEGLLECACKARQDRPAALLLAAYIAKLHRFPEIPQRLSQAEVDTMLQAMSHLDPVDAYTAVDSCGKSLLHWVLGSHAFSHEDSAEAVRILLRAGCNPDLRDTFRGATPIVFAGPQAATVLVEANADVNACDCFGCKPQHVPQSLQNERIDQTLLVVMTGSPTSSQQTPCPTFRFVDAVSGQQPWWRTCPLPPRNLPLECFPLVRVSRQSYARLCELEYLDFRQLSERANSGILFLHLYSTVDGAQMRHFWAGVDGCARACKGLKTGKTVSVVAGIAGRGTLTQGQLVVFSQDVRSEAQQRGVNAHGEFAPESSLTFLRLCAAFREHFCSRGAKGIFSQRSQSASLLELVAPLPFDTPLRTAHLIFMGPPNSGKTQLLQRLKKQPFGSRKPASPALEPTLCMESKRIETKKIVVSAFDCAGNEEYALVHEFFISPRYTVYILVFDATLSIEELRRSIMETLIRLRVHERGPRHSCRVLIFCTKADKLQEKTRATLQLGLRQYFSTIFSSQPILWDLVVVSGAKESKRFRRCVKEHITSLTRSLAPQPFMELLSALSKLPPTPLATVRQLRDILPRSLVDKLTGSNIWSNAFEFLRDIGAVCFPDAYDGPEEEEVICLDVQLVARGLGSFVAPQAHLDRLSHEKFEARKAQMSRDEFEARVRSTTGLKGDHFGMFLQLCRQLNFCCFLGAQQDIIVFPHLLPKVSSPSLPPPVPDSRGFCEAVLRMRCLGWACDACKSSFSSGELPDICPRCGKAGQCKVACRSEPRCAFCTGFIASGELPQYLAVQETKADGTRVCATISRSGKPLSLQLPPECICAEPVSDTAFLSEAAPLVGGHTAFSQLVCRHAASIDPRYRLWGNACVLHDVFGNTILLTDQEGCRLEVGVRGVAPFLWRTAFPSISIRCEPLCPLCIQAGYFVPFDPDAVPPPPAGSLACPRGHCLSASELSSGVPFSAEHARDSQPWAPKKGQFFAETDARGLWSSHKGQRVTELRPSETTPARKAEFSSAEKALFSFLGPESHGRFELRRVSFISSSALEEEFSSCHSRLLLRLWSPQEAAPSSGQDGAHLALGWQGMSERDASRILKAKGSSHHHHQHHQPDASSPPTSSAFRSVFTFQSPQWALGEARLASEAAAAKKKQRNTREFNAPGATSGCLVASWVLQGRVCTSGSATASEGFDSYLVSVPQDGISLRSADQVLPRFVFHLNSFVSSLREDLKDASAVLLTVGFDKQDADAREEALRALDAASQACKLVVVRFATAEEMHAWLCKYGYKIPSKLRLAVNDVLEEGETIDLVIDTLRAEAGNDAPVLVLVSAQAQKQPQRVPNRVLSTGDRSKLTDFCISGFI